jgi:hypothetical protein
MTGSLLRLSLAAIRASVMEAPALSFAAFEFNSAIRLKTGAAVGYSKSKQDVDAYRRRPLRRMQRSFYAVQSGAFAASYPT